MDGVLLVDKLSGRTSHDVVAYVRRIIKSKKVGHTGTLDPIATGLLILVIGKGLKIAKYLEGLDKEYVAIFKLGISTDSHDRNGKIIAQSPYEHVSMELLQQGISKFTGEILQTPPMISAVKVRGRRLYKYARKGEKVEVPVRIVNFHEIEILEFAPPIFRARIICSKGAYIRALARDLGEKLNCGIIIQDVRRTKIGHFKVENALDVTKANIEDIKKALIPVDEALPHLSQLNINPSEGQRFIRGGYIYSTIPGDLFRVYISTRTKSVFVGIGKRVGHQIKPERVIL